MLATEMSSLSLNMNHLPDHAKRHVQNKDTNRPVDPQASLVSYSGDFLWWLKREPGVVVERPATELPSSTTPRPWTTRRRSSSTTVSSTSTATCRTATGTWWPIAPAAR